ncbi:MAG: hypothetical protein RLY40_860, partial [Pseudomonadota bacterium]
MLHRWSSFADPLLSAQFFESKNYSQNSKFAKISSNDVLGFLKETAHLPNEGDVADNLAILSEEVKSRITTTALVEWLSSQSKFSEQSPIEITDQLIQSGWIDFDFNKDRLSNPNAYFYQRNLAEKTVFMPSSSELKTDHYAIYPSNLKLSWVKITNENRLADVNTGKHRIVDLISKESGLAQLQKLLSTNQNFLVNSLIQTKSELNTFFEHLNPIKKRQGFNWLKVAQLNLNLKETGKESENKALSDFLKDENHILLKKIEEFSVLATYPDPYFSDKFLTFTDYRMFLDKPIHEEIDKKIKNRYGYVEDQAPIYLDRFSRNGKNNEMITADLRAYVEGKESAAYRKEYTQTLTQIGKWLDRNNIKNNKGQLGSIALENFNNRLFNPSYSNYFLKSHEDTPYLYIEAKKNLEIIAVLLEEENISLESRNTLMSSMLADDPFTVCTAGCVMKIAAMSDGLITLYSNPNTETLIGRFINDQCRVIVYQLQADGDSLIETIVSQVWADNLNNGDMTPHAENFIKKQLATFLEMPFLMPLNDDWVMNAEAALPNKPQARQHAIQAAIKQAGNLLKGKLTLSNFVTYVWNSKINLGNDKLYHDLSVLADVINPDKNNHQLSDNYLRHYLYNFKNIQFDLDKWHEKYLTSLGSDAAILAKYFPEETINTIKEKYPSECHSLMDYILVHFADDYPEVYDRVDSDTISFKENYLTNTGLLFFSRAYVEKLTREGWVNFDLNKPRLQDLHSYFKRRNPDEVSEFNFKPNEGKIFFSNLELSWAHLKGEDQFILNFIANDKEGIDTFKDLFSKNQLKRIVNALIQTPHELNTLFERSPASQYFKILNLLIDSGLNLSTNPVSKAFEFSDIFYQAEDNKKYHKIVSYLSEEKQIILLEASLSKYPELSATLKQRLQEMINRATDFSLENKVFKANAAEFEGSIEALINYSPIVKNRDEADKAFNVKRYELDTLLTQLLKDYNNHKQAILSNLETSPLKSKPFEAIGEADLNSLAALGESVNALNDFMKKAATSWEEKLSEFSALAVKLADDANLEVPDRAYTKLVKEMNNKMQKLLYLTAYSTYSHSINLMIKSGLIKDFSGIYFIHPFTDIATIGPIDRPDIDSLFCERIDFSHCDLSGVFLMADIFRMPFHYTNLQGAFLVPWSRFRHVSDILGENFEGARFSTSSFYQVLKGLKEKADAFYKFSFSSHFPKIDGQHINFQEKKIEALLSSLVNIKNPGSYIRMEGLQAQKADFSNYYFNRMIITNANMERAIFKNIQFGSDTDFSTVRVVGAIFDEAKFGSYQQLFDIHGHGITDLSTCDLSSGVTASDLSQFLDKSLRGAILSDKIFSQLVSDNFRNFQGVNLEKISLETIKALEDGFNKKMEQLLQVDEATKWPKTYTLLSNEEKIQPGKPARIRRLESKEARLGAFKALNKKLQNKSSLAVFRLKAIDQGLYFPSYAKEVLKSPPGECIAITRGFLQSLFLGQEKIFLDNLKVVTEFSERIRLGGPELSKRESHSYEEFNKLLNHFKKDVEGQSSLPNQAIKFTEKKSLQNVMFYLDQTIPSGDYAANIIVDNHVVSLYWRGESYGYFDSNVAWVSGTGSSTKLGEVLVEAISSAGYEVGSEGVRIEVWDVADANKQLALHVDHQSSLSTKIETERSLLAQQDKKSKLILNNGQSISRTLLYDMRARVFANQDAVGQLIHSGMTANSLEQAIKNGHVSLSAKNYLENLNRKSAADIQAIGQATSEMSFVGTKSQVAIAQEIKTLLLSEKGKFLNDRDWNQIVKIASTTISEKGFSNVISFHKAAAHQRTIQAGSTNSWVNAAGRISFLRGLYSTIHSGVVGDEVGLLLGAGEMSYSFLSDAIEKGVIRITPKIIKQLKGSIFLSRGAAGLLGNAFDIVDLVQSSITLSKAEKNSKEYRDAIAGVSFASASIVSGVALTALRAPGLGTVVGLIVVIGQSVYAASSTVHELRKLHKISDDQSARSFFHALVFMSPPQDVQDQVARDNHVKITIERLLEHLEFLGDRVGLYAAGFGETKRAENGSYYTDASYAYINLTGKDYIPSQTFCGPYCSEIKIYSLDESIKSGNYRQGCEFPLMRRDQLSAYCKNVYMKGNFTRLMNDDQNNLSAFFDLKMINQGKIYGSIWNNEFQIYGGNPTVYGSANKTNWFSLFDPSFTGKIIGGADDARNVLDLSQLSVDSVVYDARRKGVARVSVIVKPNTNQTEWTYQGENEQDTLIGGRESAETVHCGDQQPFVDTKGYHRLGDHDHWYDTIYDCREAVVYGGTKIWSDGSSDVLYVKPSMGHAEVHAKGGKLIFTDSTLLTHASMKYSLSMNELYVSIPSQSFLITVSNYLDLETKQPNFNIIDRYQSHILPLFAPEQKGDSDDSDIIIITSFHIENSATPDNKAEKQWKDSQSNSMQTESDVKQKNLRVYFIRERIRWVMNLIRSKKAEEKRLKERLRLFEQCIFNYCFNPDTKKHEEMRFNSNVSNGKKATEEKLDKLERELRSNKKRLKNRYRILDHAYRKLDLEKGKLKEVLLLEEKAKIDYETTQKITVLKNEIGTCLREGVEKKKTVDNELLMSKVNGLIFLMREGLLHGDQALFSSIYPLIILIAANKIETAYLYYMSEVKVDFDDLTHDYAEISASTENHSVFGMLKLDQDDIAIMGGNSLNVLTLSQNVIYAQGGEGIDLYQMSIFPNNKSFSVTTINNKAFDREIDLLHLREVPISGSQLALTCNLLISLSPLNHLIIKNFFAGTEYQHLAFINDQGEIYALNPDYRHTVSHKSCREMNSTSIPLVPFYGVAKHETSYRVAENHWSHYASLVMNIEYGTLAVFSSNQDLILTGLQSGDDPAVVTVTLNDFYYDKSRNIMLYTYPGNVPIPFSELAKLAIPVEDIEEIWIEESVETHKVRWENESVVIPSTLNATKTHILVLEQVEPNAIRVNRTETDLVFSRTNQTITLKNWDAENTTRVNSLWFDELGRSLTLITYPLNQIAELQNALNKLHWMGLIDNKINKFDRLVINALLYFLAVNSRANKVNAAATLGFESSITLDDFIQAYGANLLESKFTDQVCTNAFFQEAVKVLPWIIIRGLINEPDKLIQKNVFSYLLDTTFDRYVFLHNQLFNSSSQMDEMQKINQTEAYLQNSWEINNELIKSFACSSFSSTQIIPKPAFQPMVKLESAEVSYEEKQVSHFSGWRGLLSVTLGTTTGAILTATLAYVGLRHLRRREQAPAVSTLAAVMIPLMSLPQAEATKAVTKNTVTQHGLVACDNSAFINLQCVKNQSPLGMLGYCSNENIALSWFINAEDSSFSYMVFAPNNYKLDAARSVSFKANSLHFLRSDQCWQFIHVDSMNCVSSEIILTKLPVTGYFLRRAQLKRRQRESAVEQFGQRAQAIGVVYLGEQCLVHTRVGDYFRAAGLTPHWHEHDHSHFLRRVLRSMQSTHLYYTLSAVCLETALLHPSVQARFPAEAYRSKLVVRFIADLLQFGPWVSSCVPALIEFLTYQHPWSYQLTIGLRGALSMLE